MESRNDISIDTDNLHKVTTAFKNKLTTDLHDPLQTIFEQHKSGLKPLTGYYISAKKGKKELSKKIAMDVTIKFIEIFVMNFMKQTIKSPEITKALTDLDLAENIDRRSHGTNFYIPETIGGLENPFSKYNISLGFDSKGNPKIDLMIESFAQEYFVKFVVNKQFQKDLIEQKIIFKVVFNGGFFDMLIKNALSDNRSFTLGELGGELLIYVTKLPFIDLKLKLLMFDKYISISLDDLIISTPKLVINSG